MTTPKKPFTYGMLPALLEALVRFGINAKCNDGHKSIANKCVIADRSIRRSSPNRTLHAFYVKHVEQREYFAAKPKKADVRSNINRRDFILSPAFYSSREWMELRYKALTLHGAKCMCCGATPGDGVKMHVDHIKPRSKFPELALDLDNMQILCELCNLGKSNKDDTDWRGSLEQESDVFIQALDRFIQARK